MSIAPKPGMMNFGSIASVIPARSVVVARGASTGGSSCSMPVPWPM